MKPASGALGWMFLALGLFLVVLMGAITLSTAPTMLHPGVKIGGSTFTGSAEQGRTFLGLFVVVILFGVTATANGLFMIVKRRHSRAFLRLLVVAFAVISSVLLYMNVSDIVVK
jgi:hypothetical protein